MARLGVILSAILVFQGVGLLSIGLLLQFLVPKLGRMAFLIGGGSFWHRDYEPTTALWVHHGLAIACILAGAFLSLRIWIRLIRPSESSD